MEETYFNLNSTTRNRARNQILCSARSQVTYVYNLPNLDGGELLLDLQHAILSRYSYRKNKSTNIVLKDVK